MWLEKSVFYVFFFSRLKKNVAENKRARRKRQKLAAKQRKRLLQSAYRGWKQRGLSNLYAMAESNLNSIFVKSDFLFHFQHWILWQSICFGSFCVSLETFFLLLQCQNKMVENLCSTGASCFRICIFVSKSCIFSFLFHWVSKNVLFWI